MAAEYLHVAMQPKNEWLILIILKLKQFKIFSNFIFLIEQSITLTVGNLESKMEMHCKCKIDTKFWRLSRKKWINFYIDYMLERYYLVLEFKVNFSCFF